jgi:hypothetical protein
MNSYEEDKAAFKMLRILLVMIAIGLLLGMFCGCKSTEYIPVVQTNTEHHWHTDSVHTADSVIRETQTTIVQLDSAEMARYGITLKQAERAWLIKTKELERQIQQLIQMSQMRDTVRDSIPVPYPVEVEKKQEQGFLARIWKEIGDVLLILLLGYSIYCGVKIVLHIKKLK